MNTTTNHGSANGTKTTASPKVLNGIDTAALVAAGEALVANPATGAIGFTAKTIWRGGVRSTTEIEEYRASSRELGEAWRRHFGKRYPAMALIGVSALYEPDARVELMGVAVLDG